MIKKIRSVTLTELRLITKNRNIERYEGMSKDELLSVISENKVLIYQ